MRREENSTETFFNGNGASWNDLQLNEPHFDQCETKWHAREFGASELQERISQFLSRRISSSWSQRSPNLMTNFEISVETTSSKYHVFGRMQLHFLCLEKSLSNSTRDWKEHSCVARLSSVRDWHVFATEDSVSFATALSWSNSLLVGLGPGSSWVSSSTSRLCFQHETIHEVSFGEHWIAIPISPRHLKNKNFKNWSHCCYCLIAAKIVECVSTKICMFSANKSSISETIIHVQSWTVESFNSNFMDECRFFQFLKI